MAEYDAKAQEEDIRYIRGKVLRKFPLLGVTMASLETYPRDNIKTACTDGKSIYYSPKFFAKLSDEEKVFVYAHEVMHVAFNHIMRSKGRHHKLWNIATDSVINQILKEENLPIVKGGVNIEEAINKSAEEMYEKLLKEREEKRKQKEEEENSDAENSGDENDATSDDEEDGDEFDEDIYDDLDDENEDIGHADHQIWKQAIEEMERQLAEQTGNAGGGSGEEGISDGERSKGEEGDFEKGFVSNNTEERAQQIQRARQMIERSKADSTPSSGHSFGDVGEVKRGEEVVDWKKLLKNSIEKEEMRWSYRRSSAENNYMARVEELESDGQAETEVMLDVSGSVNEKMVKEFLRQLKPILKQSKLKVGCFDEFVYDFKEIKTKDDIDNFQIMATSQWTENWDAAVRAFSRKKEVNKIIFTDGYPCPGTMPKEDLKSKNVIWIVYGNKDFHPCCGKVIYVDKKQFTHSSRSAYTTSSSRDYPY